MSALLKDEELHAFIDEELDAADRARVQAALEADPALAEQAMAYKTDKARLLSLYGGGLADPLPRAWIADIEEATAKRHLPRKVWAPLALAASFLLVLSGTIAWRELAQLPKDDVVADALAARAMREKPDSIVPIGSPRAMAAESAVMARSLETRVKAPDLSRLGYRLVAVDAYSAPAPSFDLRYSDRQGHAVTLYIRRSPGTARFDILEQNGLKICIWQDNVVSTVVTGDMSAAEMERLASLAYSGLTL